MRELINNEIYSSNNITANERYINISSRIEKLILQTNCT